MTKKEFKENYLIPIAKLFHERNNLLGCFNGYCAAGCCRKAREELDKAIDVGDQMTLLLDSCHCRIFDILPDDKEQSIIVEALKDQKVKNDLSKMQKENA